MNEAWKVEIEFILAYIAAVDSPGIAVVVDSLDFVVEADAMDIVDHMVD